MPSSSATGPDSRRTRPTRVLIVDDDDFSRKTAEVLLSPLGYEVIPASNGEEGLRLASESDPDLVLLDVMMPGLDGFEVCRRLRQQAFEHHLPIILLTALDGRRDVVLGLEAGADDFLHKPVYGAELRARVSNLLKVRAYHQLLANQRDSALATVDELRQQILRADRLATLGTFAAGVSHELNNIAQVLTCAVSELPATPAHAVDPNDADTRAVLHHAANHVTELARTILRIARPQEDGTPETDLRRTLGEVREMLRLTGRTRYVDMTLALPEVPCVIRASPVHAQQVFLNLISNAADALGETSQPRIEVGVRPAPDGRIEAWVRDNGPGMSQEVLARIFEPFFTTKAAGQGTGLGLPVVKQLVESWGGKLHIHSQLAQGTRVIIETPGVRPTAAPPGASASP